MQSIIFSLSEDCNSRGEWLFFTAGLVMNITRCWFILQGPSWWNSRNSRNSSNNSNNTNCLPYWFSVSWWLLTVQTDCVRHHPSQSVQASDLGGNISRTQIWYCQFVRWGGETGILLDIQIWIRNPELVLSFCMNIQSILLQKSINKKYLD